MIDSYIEENIDSIERFVDESTACNSLEIQGDLPIKILNSLQLI